MAPFGGDLKSQLERGSSPYPPPFANGCGSKNRYQNGTLESGFLHPQITKRFGDDLLEREDGFEGQPKGDQRFAGALALAPVVPTTPKELSLPKPSCLP